MNKRILTVACALLLGMTPAWAQTTTTETEAPATETTEAPKPEMTEGEAASGEATQAEPAEKSEEAQKADEAFPVAGSESAEVVEGQEYRKAVFDDWAVNCIKGKEPENCSLYQLLRDEKGNPVAEFSMLPLPKGGAAVSGVTFISPLGTLLTNKVAIRIDSGKTVRYDFNWCEKAGCISRFGLTQADLNALKRGNAATVQIASVAAPDKPLNLVLSLKGITAAWDSLTE